MTDETESAVAAWLDQPSTQRELLIAKRRLLKLNSAADPVYVCLMIEILAALNIYGAPEEAEEMDPEDPNEEPWRGK